ncbi:MAG: carboxypeptidase regulatory-like domain-containing protein [Candidatus Nomurabacteria bacterium]|nr:carboxypeptidase regulatory-like domain-containing protein [Candidatus Nomurabacteria bacterium]
MNSHKHSNGFTLIETVVGSAIFALVALAVYQAFVVLMNATLASEAKVTATELANERFEIIRNLPYIDVGIVGGLPVGKIVRTQSITRNNYIFTLTNTIRSIDDSFDGTACPNNNPPTCSGTPKDTSPADYKMIDLDISCSNCKNFSPLSFTTMIAPRALETATNNGSLFIKAIDNSGNPVVNASIHIVNMQTNPDTIIDDTTDNSGWLKIVDAPPGTGAYNITATKTGYSQDQTYPVGGAAGASPVKPDANVVTQQVTQPSFTIDKLSSLSISSADASCAALSNIGFSLTGTKLIGTGVLKYPAHSFTTDSSGNYNIPTIEWDTYSALLTSGSYDLAGAIPFPSFAINPSENKTLKLIAVPHVSFALLISVKDASGNPINGATVRLQKSPFDQTKTTNSGTCATPGQVFWNGLGSGTTYTITVTKTGFQTSTTSNYSVSSAWQNKIITLTPS